MTVNDFNSKINLPKICEDFGVTKYKFIKLPVFGWYAYTDDGFVGNIFDILSYNEGEDSIYKEATLKHPDWFDFQLAYSPLAEQKLLTNYRVTGFWNKIWEAARDNAINGKVKDGNVHIKFTELLEAKGLGPLIEAGIGYINSEITSFDRFKNYSNYEEMKEKIVWPCLDFKRKVIIPTFFTPKHIASLEIICLENFERHAACFLNSEQGWYGNITGPVVHDLNTLKKSPGFTWDYKADYWTRGTIELSPSLTVADCLNIWQSSKKTKFNKHPIDQIIGYKKEEEVENHLTKLSRDQVNELELRIDRPLEEKWKECQQEQAEIGSRIYYKKFDKYFLVKRGRPIQITNFTIDIEKIVHTDTGFFRHCMINYNGKSYPVILRENVFESAYHFDKRIKLIFFNNGIGLPEIVAGSLTSIINVINKFNEDVKIENQIG